jgi:hypothetical protein
MSDLIKSENIISQIYYIRGVKVMLDFHLAALYDVETRVLNQAVQRNIERLPEDFMFQLSDNEIKNLTSQIVTSSQLIEKKNELRNPVGFKTGRK